MICKWKSKNHPEGGNYKKFPVNFVKIEKRVTKNEKKALLSSPNCIEHQRTLFLYQSNNVYLTVRHRRGGSVGLKSSAVSWQYWQGSQTGQGRRVVLGVGTECLPKPRFWFSHDIVGNTAPETMTGWGKNCPNIVPEMDTPRAPWVLAARLENDTKVATAVPSPPEDCFQRLGWRLKQSLGRALEHGLGVPDLQRGQMLMVWAEGGGQQCSGIGIGGAWCRIRDKKTKK